MFSFRKPANWGRFLGSRGPLNYTLLGNLSHAATEAGFGGRRLRRVWVVAEPFCILSVSRIELQ